MKKYQRKGFLQPAKTYHFSRNIHPVQFCFLLAALLLPCRLPAQSTPATTFREHRGNIVQNSIREIRKKNRNSTGQTDLPLSLLGTVISSDNKDNLAIILDESNSRQNLFKVGDTVHKARIQKIERTRIILLVNGKTQVLGQKNRKGGGQAAETATVTALAVNEQPLKELPPNIMPPPPPPAPAPPPASAQLP